MAVARPAAPSHVRRLLTILAGMAKSPGRPPQKAPRSGQAFEEGPGPADARQGGAAGSGADRAGAGATAQSGDRPGYGGARARRPGCNRRRTIRSTAAGISPRRTARGNRPRDSARRRKRATWQRRRSRRANSIPDLARALGIEDDDEGDAASSTLPGGLAAPLPLVGRGWGWGSLRKTRRQRAIAHPHPPLPAHLPPPGGREQTGRAARHSASNANAADVSSFRGITGSSATASALESLLREGRPEFAERDGSTRLDAAPAAAAGEIRGRRCARHQVRLRAEGRPAGGDPRPGRRRQASRPHPGAARRHRLGQDLHDGEGDRGDAAPRAGARAEQDAGGAALRRVQVVLSRQRGGVFRLVLRLLPAGGLRPAHRHLYREGILDQRADRPHAPLGDALAAGTRRRHHRRLGVVHLRYRLGRDLFGDDLHAQAGRAHQPAPDDRRPGGAAVQALRRRFLPRLVPGARRRHRDFPRALRGPRLAGVAVRRRDRIDPRIRSAHRPQDRRAGVRQDLRQLALRHAAADADPGDPGHQARAAAAARTAQRRRPAARSAAARAAHHLRSRNDGGDRKLRRHRELFALSHRPQARRAAADAVRIRARQRAGVRRRKPRHHPAARRHVPRRLPAQGDARRIRLPAAVLHGQPAAAVRGMGRDAAADHGGVGDAQLVGDRSGRRRVRRAGDPPDRPDRSAGRRAPGAHAGRRSGRRGAAGGGRRATARWSRC